MELRALFIIVILAVGLPWPAEAITREDLVCPVRGDWDEGSEECPCEKGWKPTEAQLRKMLAAHKSWFGKQGWENAAISGQAVLCNSDLSYAKLERAFLAFAHLERAKLANTNLNKANLAGANLREADFLNTNLREAILWGANLRGAILGATNLEAAQLSGAALAQSIYLPLSQPAGGPNLAGITGLASVVIPYDEKSSATLITAMVQLRKLLSAAGLREQVRQATFAIEHHKALHAREHGSAFGRLGGWLQLIFFEWTTGWGLSPSRALLIMLGLMVGMTVVYVFPIWIFPYDMGARNGIYRIWPRDRLDPVSEATLVAEDTYAERLTEGLPAAIPWAFYFSMLSAFHIGWRDLNVGTWVTRMQPTEFALRGRGWVRVVSGFQSLISVYLLAMWVLTYFGRPFQ